MDTLEYLPFTLSMNVDETFVNMVPQSQENELNQNDLCICLSGTGVK